MLEPRDLLRRTADLAESGWSPRAIRSAVARGHLTRLRRGWYVDTEVWRDCDERRRHVLRMSAADGDQVDAVFAGRSAAAAWGIPLFDPWPSDVLLLDRQRGGGASEPGVRRTVIVAKDAPIVRHRGFRVTSLARTVVDLAAREGAGTGLVAADWALAGGLSARKIAKTAHERRSAYGRAAIQTTLSLMDGRSESPGESAARFAIHELGFAVPELQAGVADGIRVDFLWREAGVVGEFDGMVKYVREEFTGGDPARVLWREKRREDRIRALGLRVVRIVFDDLRVPQRLAAELRRAGVPRRRTVRSEPEVSGSKRTVLEQSA